MITGLSLIIAACQSNTGVLISREWEDHRYLMETLSTWTLQGRLNIRQQNNSDTVSVNWQQQEQDFVINLSGVFGLGATMISGDQYSIRLERGNEEVLTAASLNEFTREVIGYEFPAEVLYYWVRGIPAPDRPADIELNDQQLLSVLRQIDSQGNTWQLEYDRYTVTDGHSLPGRIRMSQADYRLTLLIQDWQFSALEG
jgi:outer membrane lipoprotein LolB